jgi:hypothetical protein
MMSREESFRPFEGLIREWLTGARVWEIAWVLKLVSDELRRRGFVLTWTTTPPLTERARQ